MTKLSIIVASYDSGHYDSGFGRGPGAILDSGLVDSLTQLGHDASVREIGRVGDRQGREIATGFAVCNAVATCIRAAREEGRFPVVLAGNCLTALGAVAGGEADSILWFDQHGDLNTPETSIHGFLDGMALAATLGLCWRPMTAAIPGFRPIEADRCLLVDARDLDLDEATLLEGFPIRHVSCDEALGQARGLAATGVIRTHLHLDLDIHDPSMLPVNRYAKPGGPGPDELRLIIRETAQSLPLSGMTITAYDPEVDPEARVPSTVTKLLADLLPALESSSC